MLLLTIAIVALLAGVLALPLVRRRTALLAGLDGFVAVFIGGLVALHILPEAVSSGGLWALLAGLLGLALPLGAHGLHRRHRGTGQRGGMQRALLVVAAVGLAIHAAVDGVALATAAATAGHAHHHGGHAGDAHDVVLAASGGMLGLAVLAHKLPTGLALGWIVERAAGMRVALLAALGASLATIAGYAAASAGMLSHGSLVLAIFNAFVAGSLLHVVTGHAAERGARAARPTLGGAALACVLLVLVLRDPLALLALLAAVPLLRATRAHNSPAPAVVRSA